jgi:tRNA(His) 5'-end guanylyltransferase
LHFEKKDDILMELTKTAENKTENDAWLSLVERYVRDVEVAGSNPVASIPWQGRVEKSGKIFGFFFYSMMNCGSTKYGTIRMASFDSNIIL